MRFIDTVSAYLTRSYLVSRFGGPGDLAHVDVAAGVDPDAVRGVDDLPRLFPFLAPLADDGTPEIENADPLLRFGEVDGVVAVDEEIVARKQVGPGLQEAAPGVEYLDAGVAAVEDEDAVVPVDADAVRGVELTRPGAVAPPGAQQLARGGEPVHVVLPVPVGDVEVVVVPRDHPGGGVERLARRSGFSGGTQGLQQLSLQGVDGGGVQGAVGYVDAAPPRSITSGGP